MFYGSSQPEIASKQLDEVDELVLYDVDDDMAWLQSTHWVTVKECR